MGSLIRSTEGSIPRAIPCTRLANLILPPKRETQNIAARIPRWGVWVAAHLLESKAWAMYREREKRFASLIGGRAAVVLHRQLPGMGMAKRYIIAIADDSRAPLDSLCAKLAAADIACDVMRNTFARIDPSGGSVARPSAMKARATWRCSRPFRVFVPFNNSQGLSRREGASYFRSLELGVKSEAVDDMEAAGWLKRINWPAASADRLPVPS